MEWRFSLICEPVRDKVRESHSYQRPMMYRCNRCAARNAASQNPITDGSSGGDTENWRSGEKLQVMSRHTRYCPYVVNHQSSEELLGIWAIRPPMPSANFQITALRPTASLIEAIQIHWKEF